MTADRLEMAARWLRDWIRHDALPLWAGAGFDHEHLRFEERLTLSGGKMTGVPVRLMVQARQIYSYSMAARKGWHPGAAGLVETAYASMIRDFYRPDRNAGWAFSIGRDGTPIDRRRDLYAHAFVLLGVASVVELAGRNEPLSLADETLAFLDDRMRAPGRRGFLESLPPVGGPRRQNPHMHLFEGLLALWTASGEERYLRRADELFELFRSRFFRSDHGVLGEYFDRDLEPAEGTAGRIVEPGHHYEWVWLLRRFERETGRTVQPYIDALYLHADRHGFDREGLIVDELLADGSPRSAFRRVWPVTEAIRANAVEAALGRPGAAAKAASLADTLRGRFLKAGGGWIDRLDDKGDPAVDFMPASTLYHLMGAVAGLDVICPDRAPTGSDSGSATRSSGPDRSTAG